MVLSEIASALGLSICLNPEYIAAEPRWVATERRSIENHADIATAAEPAKFRNLTKGTESKKVE